MAVRSIISEYEKNTPFKHFLYRDRQVAEHGYDISCDEITFLSGKLSAMSLKVALDLEE